MAEFLPICDLLFNVISLTIYFCDLVFDLVFSYALLDRGLIMQFAITFSIILFTSIFIQIISLKWFLKSYKYRVRNDIMCNSIEILTKKPSLDTLNNRRSKVIVNSLLHVLQLGVIWRYAKLLVPVNVQFVKYDVRDLCLLRMVHAFCQSAPMLMFETYILLKTNLNQSDFVQRKFLELIRISISLSLISICWSLASFSKNVRLHKVHKLVLTWLGVIIQFLWRLGIVSSRILALVNYAAIYYYWIFLVLFLHWLLTFLWLLTPKNVFHNEGMSIQKKCRLCALIAFVMIIDYINLQEINHKQKMVIFYFVMFIENLLLVTICSVSVSSKSLSLIILFVGLFFTGLVFMILYYSFFHISRLNGVNEHINGERDMNFGKNSKFNQNTVHGVFNCRFTNPAFSNSDSRKRKKKKPTSFIPPPNLNSVSNEQPLPFWRQPLPQTQNISSENECNSSVGSRVNIYQKLQEKKQKQLAELKIIEEEIKQGILARDCSATNNAYMLLPVPQQKLHDTSHLHYYYNNDLDYTNEIDLVNETKKHLDQNHVIENMNESNINSFEKLKITKCEHQLTPEILLSPHYFHNKNLFAKHDTEYHENDDYFEIKSDVESQISLPRSYTLPREFKYYRRRKLITNILPSTNSSSDGDVESDDATNSNIFPNRNNIINNNRKKFQRFTGRKWQRGQQFKRETKL